MKRLRTERIEARAAAAELSGQSMSEFVMNAAHEKAVKTIKDYKRIELGLEDQLRFTVNLTASGKPSPAMQRVRTAHRRLFNA